MNYETLLDIIKRDEEIEYYLENVTLAQFKKDVLKLSSINASKEIIQEAINTLQSLI